MKTACKPAGKRQQWRKLNQQGARSSVKAAQDLSHSIEDKPMEGLNLVFPVYIYNQILKGIR